MPRRQGWKGLQCHTLAKRIFTFTGRRYTKYQRNKWATKGTLRRNIKRVSGIGNIGYRHVLIGSAIWKKQMLSDRKNIWLILIMRCTKCASIMSLLTTCWTQMILSTWNILSSFTLSIAFLFRPSSWYSGAWYYTRQRLIIKIERKFMIVWGLMFGTGIEYNWMKNARICVLPG